MYDVKYAPFADSYIGMAHGDTYEHVKRWLKQRFTFVDTLFDYAPSYNNDVLTIRANTTELMTLEIETYTPVYQHVSWYNGQMDKKKIDGKVSVEFSGTAQAATDQEVLIYGGSNVKSIKGITSMNPNRMLIGSATKLVEIDAHDCPLLADINANKANLSPHEYLNKVNLSNCPLLEGNLRLNNSPLVQEINIKGTNITGMNLPSSIRNLQTLRLPNTMTELTLNDASMLHTLEFDEGVNLQSVSMTNCNALENVTNFDLLQTPSITLNNSYNNIAELYFKDTTSLSLSNMSNLERVIFTPNNEYETFELINVANAPDYKVTTFNCPKLSTFMTTAPYRESYNNGEYGDIQQNTTFTANSIDISSTQFTDVKLLCTTDTNTLKLPTTVKNFYCDSSFDLDTDYLEDGEYDVVHGELVEPYTTDYEDEVLRIETGEIITEITKWTTGYKAHAINNVLVEDSAMQVTDYIEVVPGSTIYVENHTATSSINLIEYVNKDDTTVRYSSSQLHIHGNRQLQSDTKFVRINTDINATLTIRYNGVNPYTPNLIPSSADGSLIFSMYAPSNTVAPASGVWDLKGLEFDNFHTFGMNNDVKGIYEVVEVRNAAPIYRVNGYKYITGNLYDTEVNSAMCILSPILLDEDVIKLQVVCNTNVSSVLCWSNGTTDTTQTYRGKWLGYNQYEDITSDKRLILLSVILEESGKTLEYFDLITTNETGVTTVRYYINDIPTLDVTNDEIKNWTNVEYKYIYQEKPTSITMPSRYDDYNITLKNANISPKTHNTMLYPLLVNEDNPITGTLDYTNYAGKHLSWSFAYTDEEYVNIIQPKEELINSYEYKYNAFYDTEYEFENPYEVAKYTSNASGVLPSFNTEFTYTYDEIDNSDGTYTTRVYTDSLDNLPTSINFIGMPIISVDKLNTSQATNLQGLFQSCTKLERVDTRYWDTSKVTTMRQAFFSAQSLISLDLSNLDTTNVKDMTNMFNGCSKLTSLNLSDFDTSNVTEMHGMFNGCSSLTDLDLSDFDTSNVTNMSGMFQNCSNLVSLDLSSFDTTKVDNMQYIFCHCNKLTDLDVSNFDTSNVTLMTEMFRNCSNLTDLDVSNFNTTKVINMSYMFQNCSSLTELDVSNFDTTNVTNMSLMFYGCSKLTSLDLSDFDTSEVADMNNMFYNCSNLTSLNLSDFNTSNVTRMDSMFNGCSSLISLDLSDFNTLNVVTMVNMFYNCSNLTSLNISNFATTNVTDMYAMFYNCSNLTSLDLSKFDTTNVTRMYGMFYGCSKLTEITGLNNWNTENVTEIGGMFNSCTNLVNLNVSNWDLRKVTKIYNTFANCRNLTSLDLSGWNIANVTEIGDLFYNCTALASLDSMQNISTNLVLSSTVLNTTSLLDIIDNLVTLKVVVNEVNCTLIESGGTDMETGEIKSGTSCVSDETFYEVYAGKTYEINTNGSWLYVSYYYTNKAFRGSLYRGANNTNDSCIVTPSENGYIRVSAVKAPNANTTITIKECILNPQTLTLGSTLLAKLTENQIAIATDKGWTVL